MYTRRQFLAGTGSILAGFATIPQSAFALASGRDDTSEIRMVLEHSFLVFELTVFERKYLPVLFAKTSPGSSFVWPAGQTAPPCLGEWQAAARRLAHAPLTMQDTYQRLRNGRLGAPSSSQLGPVNSAEFAPLFRSCCYKLEETPSKRDFIESNGRVNWQIYPAFHAHYDKDIRSLVAEALPSAMPSDNPHREVAQNLPAFKAYLHERIVKSDALLNRELQRYLAILADFDADFVVGILDVDYIQRLVRTAEGFTPEKRAEQMRSTGKPYFPHACLSAGVALLMQTLANNHFFHIGRLLKTPYARGYWNCFVPAHIFAVLYHKKAILSELALAKQGGAEATGPQIRL